MQRCFLDCPNCGEEAALMYTYQRMYGYDFMAVEKCFCDCQKHLINDKYGKELRYEAIGIFTGVEPK